VSDVLNNVTEAKVVRVQPGDVIWLKVGHATHMDAITAAQIKERAKKIWPDNDIAVGVDIDVELVRTTETAA
jgi:hypothetical protein